MTQFAQFEDRYTLRHTRRFPHPMEDVFEALTISDEMNKWMMPQVDVEPRLGGECYFSWGGPWRPPPGPRGLRATVTEFDPPRRVTYTFDDGSYLRFELEATGDETSLVLIHHVPRPGLPTLTLWPPNVVHGFHIMLDDLGALVAGITDEEWARARLDATASGRFFEFTYDPANAPRHVPEEVWRQSNATTGQYAEHIAKNCPAEQGPDAAERDAGPFTLSVRDVPDEEVTSWAEAGMGFGPMLDMMFNELRDRLDADKRCRIGFNLGRGLEWSFDIEQQRARLTRRPTGDEDAVVRGAPVRMLRVLAQGLTPDAIERSGLTTEGDSQAITDFCSMTPTARAG